MKGRRNAELAFDLQQAKRCQSGDGHCYGHGPYAGLNDTWGIPIQRSGRPGLPEQVKWQNIEGGEEDLDPSDVCLSWSRKEDIAKVSHHL